MFQTPLLPDFLVRDIYVSSLAANRKAPQKCLFTSQLPNKIVTLGAGGAYTAMVLVCQTPRAMAVSVSFNVAPLTQQIEQPVLQLHVDIRSLTCCG